jgi:magnesium-transporting ATPase (P-type)
VEYAHTAAKYDLVQRDKEFVQIKNTLGFVENYDILADFPFKSNQRKQSILLKNRETGTVVYFAKGAEMVMETRVLASQKEILNTLCDQLAAEGLRALAFA